MLSVDVIDRTRKVVGKVEVRKDLLQGPINRLLLSDGVRAQLANAREGNADTKTRRDVLLTTKKAYKQKGTGNARHGSHKAPTFVGGGTVFGPHPRDYRVNVPQKMRKLAFLSALRLKYKEGKLLVTNDFSLKAPKTKEAARYFKDLNVDSAVFVLPNRDESIQKSMRNLMRMSAVVAQGFRLVDMMKPDYVIFTPEALKHLETRIFGEE